MARPRKIDRHPELREALARARERGTPLDEVLEFVREWFGQHAPGETVVRSTVATWLARIDVIGERVQRTRQAAEILTERWGAGSDRLVVRAAIDALQSAITDIVLAVDGEGRQLDLTEITRAARALRELATAERASVDVIERERAAAVEADRREQKDRLQQAGASGRIAPDAMLDALEIMGLG